MSYFRKNENRPALTGRVARRETARTEARAFATAHRMPVIGHVQRALVAASRAGHLFAGDYLVALGVDPRFASAFGKAVRKAYVENHGAEPDCCGLAIINGRIRPTFRYSNPLDLIAGALAYPRTADLVLALPAGHPVARQFAGV
jgi:hypothetical protein